MIKVTDSGSFTNMMGFLQRMQKRTQFSALEKYGAVGVAALRAATPESSAETANGWYYEIIDRPGYFSIHWLNSHTVEPGNIPVAVLIQYGHATRSGSWIEGRDYINPALKPIFDQIVNDMWKEVTK